MVSELGNTRITLHVEHGVFHLKHTNILGAGKIWECFDSTNGGYSQAVKQFKALMKIQTGLYYMKNYDVKPSPEMHYNNLKFQQTVKV